MMQQIPIGGSVSEETVALKSGAIKVRVVKDASGNVKSYQMPPAFEAKLDPAQRASMINYFASKGLGLAPARPTAAGAPQIPQTTRAQPPPVRTMAMPRPLAPVQVPTRTTQQPAQQPAQRVMTGSPALTASSSPGPVPAHLSSIGKAPKPAGIQAPAQVTEQIKRAMEADKSAVSSPVQTRFASLDDAIERLLPYHLLAYPDFTIADEEEAEAQRLESKRAAIIERYEKMLKQGRFSGGEIEHLLKRLQLDELRNEAGTFRQFGPQ